MPEALRFRGFAHPPLKRWAFLFPALGADVSPWTRQPPWDPDATHVESVGAPDALQRPRARHKKAHRFSGGKAEINAECLGHGTRRPPFQRWAAGCRDRPIAAPDPLPLPWDWQLAGELVRETGHPSCPPRSRPPAACIGRTSHSWGSCGCLRRTASPQCLTRIGGLRVVDVHPHAVAEPRPHRRGDRAIDLDRTHPAGT